MQELEAQVTNAMEELQQMLKEDGSEVSLVSLDGAHVTLRLKSVLCNCTSSELELHQEIRGFLRNKVPDIESIRITA
jgi:Fe-S cluster biogenesis protein NfuA